MRSASVPPKDRQSRQLHAPSPSSLVRSSTPSKANDSGVQTPKLSSRKDGHSHSSQVDDQNVGKETVDAAQWRAYVKSLEMLPVPMVHLPKRTGEIEYYHVRVEGIAGIQLPPNLRRSTDFKFLRFVVQVSLFDTVSKNFFGCTWSSEYFKAFKRKDNTLKLISERGENEKDGVFSFSFRSQIRDPACVGVAELVVMLKGSGILSSSKTLGWTVLNLFGHQKTALTDVSLADTNDKAVMQHVCNFYHGSPTILLLLPKEQDMWQAHLHRNESCKMWFRMFSYAELSKVSHLFRENELLAHSDSTKDRIGGFPSPPDDSDQFNIKNLPKIPSSLSLYHWSEMTFHVVKPTVFLPIGFERELLKTIEVVRKEWEAGDELEAAKEGFGVIKDRTLRVGLHNGRTFVEPPTEVHLKLVDDTKATRGPWTPRAGGGRESSLLSQEASVDRTCHLEFTGSAAMTVNCDIRDDPKVALVFELEYEVGWSRNMSFVVASSYLPLATDQHVRMDGKVQLLHLQRGPSPTINQKRVFGSCHDNARQSSQLWLTVALTSSDWAPGPGKSSRIKKPKRAAKSPEKSRQKLAAMFDTESDDEKSPRKIERPSALKISKRFDQDPIELVDTQTQSSARSQIADGDSESVMRLEQDHRSQATPANSRRSRREDESSERPDRHGMVLNGARGQDGDSIEQAGANDRQRHTMRTRGWDHNEEGATPSQMSGRDRDRDRELQRARDRELDDRTLPEDWTEERDSLGRVFYYNRRLKITQWTDPRPLPRDWELKVDQAGHSYYRNRRTGDTQWEDPRAPLDKSFEPTYPHEAAPPVPPAPMSIPVHGPVAVPAAYATAITSILPPPPAAASLYPVVHPLPEAVSGTPVVPSQAMLTSLARQESLFQQEVFLNEPNRSAENQTDSLPPVVLQLEFEDHRKSTDIVLEFKHFYPNFACSAAQGITALVFSFHFFGHPAQRSKRVPLEVAPALQNDVLAVDGQQRSFAFSCVFPLTIPHDDHASFIEFLYLKSLVVDVWDGDSFFLLGTAHFPLSSILRQGLRTVSKTLSAPITEQPLLLGGPWMSRQRENEVLAATQEPLPLRIRDVLGDLVIEVQNTGVNLTEEQDRALTYSSLHTIPATRHKGELVISGADPLNVELNSGNSSSLRTSSRVVKAKLLRDTKPAVLSRLSGLAGLAGFAESGYSGNSGSPVAVVANKQTPKASSLTPIRKVVGSYAPSEDDKVRSQNLKSMDAFRNNAKMGTIATLLRQKITQSRTIRPFYAQTVFFELSFTNPYSKRAFFTIQIDDPFGTRGVGEMAIVSDVKEWLHLKRQFNLSTPTKVDLFATEDSEQPHEPRSCRIVLDKDEQVHIPIKYQSWQCGDATNDVAFQTASLPDVKYNVFPCIQSSFIVPMFPSLEARTVQIGVCNRDREAVCFLNVDIRPRPMLVDRTVRAHSWSEETIREKITIPSSNASHDLTHLSGIRRTNQADFGKLATNYDALQVNLHVRKNNSIAKARCSNERVAFDLKLSAGLEPEMEIAVQCGRYPQVERFHLSAFCDVYGANLHSVTQVLVHAHMRATLGALVGQRTPGQILLPAQQRPRMVRCYSSTRAVQFASKALELRPEEVHHVNYLFKAHTAGSHNALIHVVDCESHVLLYSWLLAVDVVQPRIETKFTVALRCGQENRKQLPYNNPFQKKRSYFVESSKPELVEVTRNVIEIPALASRFFPLVIHPQFSPQMNTVFLFVTNEDGKLEDTLQFDLIFKD